MAEVNGGCFFAFLWFLALVFVSFLAATICFLPYLIVSIFVPCIPGLKPIADFLLLGINFPYTCSDGMVNQKPCGGGN